MPLGVLSLLLLTCSVHGLQLPYPLPKSITASSSSISVIGVSPNITVSASPNHLFSVEMEALESAILLRYETLLRNKVSARAAQVNAFRRISDSLTTTSLLQVSSAALHLSHVHVTVTGKDTTLGPHTDESYTVVMASTTTSAVTASVSAVSIYGARHGLESLSQLIEAPAGVIHTGLPLKISDSPAFTYRALMIDTGRHYLSLDVVRHAIDGMAALKLNTLHWHLLDSSSFPVKSEKYPQLVKGAFATAAVYSLDDLRGVVAYARSRGVRVIPEIEMPGHGSFSAGMPELSLRSCSDVLDPTRNSTYEFLAEFLAEMTSVFDDDVIMLGGDEVGFDPKCHWPGNRVCGYHCFDEDHAVAEWMKQHGLNSSQMLGYFWRNIRDAVIPRLPAHRTVGVWMADTPNGAGGKMHLWPAPNMHDLPQGSIANVYQSMHTAGHLLDQGVPVVLSVAGSDWYLDYHPTFERVYSVRPCDAAQLNCDAHPHRRAGILGGSVSQWGERVDFANFDVDVWTGASALAERLWSDLPLLPNATAASAAAAVRHNALSCHWKMWGVKTIIRQTAGGEFVMVKDASIPTCPADWCKVPS